MKLSTSGMGQQGHEEEKKCLNSELWHACAGPLVSLPTVGSRVVYFPQGHSEQVSVTTSKEIDSHIPNYPSLPPQLICQLHNVTMHADIETDEVYAQMMLQPLTPQEQKDAYLPVDLGTPSRQPTNYFCKTLTASDTSTHGGFSVPRRAAEKVFPPLDFSQTPPAQELIARDLHDVEWKFRHIFRESWIHLCCLKQCQVNLFTPLNNPQLHTVEKNFSSLLDQDIDQNKAGEEKMKVYYCEEIRCQIVEVKVNGQPKRHLLTTGWSVFVSAKRLVAGDSVLFIWNDNNQLFLGIRRASRPQTVMPSSVLSSDSMHIGLLAAAAHAAATNSCFTIFYNPRACPSEFVIPFSKYVQAVYHTRVSVGMRFRMLFETEESSVRRYMGTITGISDLDPVRWPNSHWRSVKVGWDESTAGERQPRVSLWEIEPLTTFPMYPSLFPLRLKRPWCPGASSSQDAGNEAINSMAWLRGEAGQQGFDSMNFQSAGMIIPWMQQRFDPMGHQNDIGHQQYQAMLAAGLQNFNSGELLKNQLMQFQQPLHYLQNSGVHNPVSQPVHTIPAMAQMLSGNMQSPPQRVVSQLEKHQQEHNYQGPYFVQHDIASSSFSKSDFMAPNNKVFASMDHASLQNMTSSICSEGSGNLLSFSRIGEPILTEQSPQQSWVVKYSGKDASVEQETCSLDVQNQGHFGANSDSSGLLIPRTVSIAGTAHGDISSIPSGYPSPLYGCVHDSSDMLQSTGELDQPTANRTFVKVYKAGSVGRSLDIAQFSSYQELRQELGQMFGIEGLLEDPQRSGWQLVFVDRENDVLLLGDDPWEAFVNNVWYIKILSPEDVLKLGKQEAESLSRSEIERLNNVGAQNSLWTPISRIS